MITALYRRKLKPGTQYNDLIPDSECTSIYKGDGDTYLSMDIIKEFIEDYSYQVKKLAPLLKGRSLQQTVANIYDFLYHHIQYKADGAAQYIKSPQCTWHSRDKGTDCKSYTVFAGAICKELNLPFSIRKVQQPVDPPGTFSHVYIIVHDSKKTHLVIDATKHQNTESPFITKHDISMKHYGLNASIPSAQMRCAFHDYFGRICNSLEEKEVSKKQISNLKNEVNEHIEKTGHYPLIEVHVDKVYVNDKAHTFTTPSGATVLVATKNTGLNSAVAAAGAAAASDAVKKAAPKILSKVKDNVGKIWKSITCKLKSSAWDNKMAKAYEAAIENHFTQIINKFIGSPESYFIPNNLGESNFTRDLNKHILEFWSENAKYEFENNTYGQKHNSCSKISREAAIRATEAYYAAIQELYAAIQAEYPLEYHMVATAPLMNFFFNDLWDFNETVNEARKKGYNNPIPQIQLPKITVNVEELARMGNPRPNIPDKNTVIAPSLPGNNSGTTTPSIGNNNTAKITDRVNTDRIKLEQNTQKAGFGLLPALLIVAGGYSAYKMQQNSKTKKKTK